MPVVRTHLRPPSCREGHGVHDGGAGARPVTSPMLVGHRVNHGGGGEDQDVVLPGRYLYSVGVAGPEPSLGHLGDPLPVALEGVLVIDHVALDAQVRAVFDLDRPLLALRRDHGLLDQSYPVPGRIFDLHAVLEMQHALLDLAQFAAVHVLEPDRLADRPRLAVQLEDVLAAIVFDHVVVSDGDHALAYLVTRGPALFLAALAPPVPAEQRPCLRLYGDVPHVCTDRTRWPRLIGPARMRITRCPH